jgi:hypothetical protein
LSDALQCVTGKTDVRSQTRPGSVRGSCYGRAARSLANQNLACLHCLALFMLCSALVLKHLEAYPRGTIESAIFVEPGLFEGKIIAPCAMVAHVGKHMRSQ